MDEGEIITKAIGMLATSEDRAVARDEIGEIVVDTCFITDGQKSYETAVRCPDYNSGKWVIVQSYDSKEEAEAGHAEWVTMVRGDKLPQILYDVATNPASLMLDKLIGKAWRVMPRGTGVN